jgi:hypothetical protein
MRGFRVVSSKVLAKSFKGNVGSVFVVKNRDCILSDFRGKMQGYSLGFRRKRGEFRVACDWILLLVFFDSLGVALTIYSIRSGSGPNPVRPRGTLSLPGRLFGFD